MPRRLGDFRMASTTEGRKAGGASAAAALTALGVVYGDIGTSPIYALRETVKAAAGGGQPGPEAVIGSVSLIVWALVVVVAVKYAILILKADNKGEGGIVAMIALLGTRHAEPRSRGALLLVVGLVGAALLYGDGAITPAISVLSAVEGLKLDAPGVEPYVVPITVAILAGLFLVQRKGTAFIGRIFGPVMLAWFAAIALVGVVALFRDASILKALDPVHAFRNMVEAGPAKTFAMLGAAFLAVTGGEAMYADLGHFGRFPIRLAWFTVVLPALVLNYLGQGAMLLADPSAIDNPFFQSAPGWAHYPLVAFSTLATVIASQSIISGAFSLTEQSIKLGFFPRMRIVHTSADEAGQIYVPIVNWLLAAATLGAVLIFRSSDALAGAYGIAVSLLMVITTVFAALIAIRWGFNPVLVLAVNGAFLVVDLTFFGANSLKLLDGGWFPLLLAGIVAFLMMTWRRGMQLVEASRADARMPSDDFLAKVKAKHLPRIPGTGVFLSSAKDGMPLPLTNFVHHLHVLHEKVVLATVIETDDPRVADGDRAEAIPVAENVTRVLLRFGFLDRIDVPAALGRAIEEGKLPGIEADRLTYFISHETVVPSEDHPAMSGWRGELFAIMRRNSEETATYLAVPAKRVMQVGAEVEV